MFIKKVCLVSAIFALTSAAPKRISRSTVPIWHMPCGEGSDLEITSSEHLEEDIKSNFEILRLQHQLTMNDYLNRDYEYLYERVRIGIRDHQYIPNWVPGKKDTNLVRRLADANSQTVSAITEKIVAFLRCTCFESRFKLSIIKNFEQQLSSRTLSINT